MGIGERGFLAKGSRRFMELPSGLAISSALCSWLRLHGAEHDETPRGEFRVSNHFTNRAAAMTFQIIARLAFNRKRSKGRAARRPGARRGILAKCKK